MKFLTIPIQYRDISTNTVFETDAKILIRNIDIDVRDCNTDSTISPSKTARITLITKATLYQNYSRKIVEQQDKSIPFELNVTALIHFWSLY